MRSTGDVIPSTDPVERRSTLTLALTFPVTAPLMMIVWATRSAWIRGTDADRQAVIAEPTCLRRDRRS